MGATSDKELTALERTAIAATEGGLIYFAATLKKNTSPRKIQ